MGLTKSAAGGKGADDPSPESPEQLADPVASAQRNLEAEESYHGAIEREFASRMGISNTLMENIIGGGFMLVIGIIMLGFLFDLDLVSNFSGPFSDQLTTVETVLGAAIVFAVLGILALAGVYAYSMFQSAR